MLTEYAGLPFSDERRAGGPQAIPGPVMCAYFDRGGEGVGYHTEAARNEGSGALNPADGSYLNEFRIDEPVGTTYTKTDIDDTEFNAFDPEIGMLYVGWTAAGQWLNYTVEVARDGVYSLDVLYTAAERGGAVSVAVDGEDQTGPLELASMFDSRETLDWRQVHHWARSGPVAELRLGEGLHVLTLRIEVAGHLNLAKLEFRLVR